MNKTDLINRISEQANLSKAQAKMALDAMTDGIISALETGDKVSLLGFGTFSVSERNERTGINPRTGETLIIPARKTVKFKAGAELAQKVK